MPGYDVRLPPGLFHTHPTLGYALLGYVEGLLRAQYAPPRDPEMRRIYMGEYIAGLQAPADRDHAKR